MQKLTESEGEDVGRRTAVIDAETAAVRPPLLPELTLRLVTPAQRWWWSDPAALATEGVHDPYWAFAWPGGTALARLILDRPDLVRGRRVVDLGGGSGVAGLAAARAGAAAVTINDIDPWALTAARLNAAANDLSVELSAADLIGGPHPGCDVLLLGDVTYAAELVTRLSTWLATPTVAGMTVLAADPGRGYCAGWPAPLTRLKVPAEVDGTCEHWTSVDIRLFTSGPKAGLGLASGRRHA